MLKTQFAALCPSPFGQMLLTSNGSELTGLHLPGFDTSEIDDLNEDAVLRETGRQLRAYFAGKLQAFDIPLSPPGTPFQRRAWEELCRIPYGMTISYAEQARRIGRPSASRAVGGANGRNPIAIIVPCHRVIGANGTLTGYGGGLDRKQWLLDHEFTVLAKRSVPPRPRVATLA